MKPFRLQTILEYRQRLEDEAHKALMLSIEEQNQLIAERDAEQAAVNRLGRECEEAKTNQVQLQEIMLYDECLVVKKRQVLVCEHKILEQEKIVRQKQEALTKARQEKRILEMLKEKRSAAEKERQEQQEKAFLDELGVLNFGGRYDRSL